MWQTNFTDVYTNLETGKSATEVSAEDERILSVTDNGDARPGWRRARCRGRGGVL
jgi:hypothetical protein